MVHARNNWQVSISTSIKFYFTCFGCFCVVFRPYLRISSTKMSDDNLYLLGTLQIPSALNCDFEDTEQCSYIDISEDPVNKWRREAVVFSAEGKGKLINIFWYLDLNLMKKFHEKIIKKLYKMQNKQT